MHYSILKERLLARFLRYVQIDTTADETTDRYPSSDGQRDLGAALVQELSGFGVDEVQQDENGLVWATLLANTDHEIPTIGLCAHLDTSPETSGLDVRPQVIRDYAGGDLTLPGNPDRVIRFDETPELKSCVGKTVITSDGTTLLGADDKAGIAIIVELLAFLTEHPEIPHGRIRVCFTCDEEIGRGVDRLDPARFDAIACYTIDGGATDLIDIETFSADLAVVTIDGVNIHPSIAKDRMTNAVRVAAHFVDQLPQRTLAPESTERRKGFLHPYTIQGGVDRTTIRILLRSFDAAELEVQAELLRTIARSTEAAYPGAKIGVNVTPQYRNLAEGLAKEPRAVAYAEEALRRLGRTAKRTIVRGGTDGSRLTELGLPTPNLSCGGHTPHSPLEWACLEEMKETVAWLVSLIEVWADVKR